MAFTGGTYKFVIPDIQTLAQSQALAVYTTLQSIASTSTSQFSFINSAVELTGIEDISYPKNCFASHPVRPPMPVELWGRVEEA